MKKMIDYIDAAKAITGSDNKTALRMGVTRAAISHYRSGRSIPDEYGIFQLAEILEIDEREIFIALHVQSEKNPAKRRFWEKLAGASLGIIFSVSIFMSPTPSEAAPALNQWAKSLYIMLNGFWTGLARIVHSKTQNVLAFALSSD